MKGWQIRKGRASQILFFVCLFNLIAASSDYNAQNLINLNENITYQTMVGWDIMGQAGLQADLFYETNMEVHYSLYIDTLVSLLVDQMGGNMIQLDGLRCGYENNTDYWQVFWMNQDPGSHSDWRNNRYVPINDNNDPFSINWNGFKFSELDSTISNLVLPLRQKLATERGESLYVYLNYVDFATSAFEHRENPEEYAEFVEAAIEHIYNTWGFYVDGIDVINEPDNGSDPGWDSSTKVANCTKALIDRIQSRGWDIDIIAPATLSMGRADNFFDNTWSHLADDDTSYFRLLAYHRYSGSSAGNLQNIEDRVLAHPLLGGFMNEWWHNGNGYQILHEDLKNGANAAWQQGVACSPFSGSKTPLYRVDTTQSPPHVYLADKTKYTMLYYRYVRPGAVRIEAATTNNDFDPLAFINTDGKYTVIVKADQGGDFMVQGLPPGLYGLKYTTSNEYDISLPDVTINPGDILNTNIPAQGVITIFTQGVLGPAPDIDVTPSSHNYGDIALGDSSSQTFVVSNEGLLPLNINGSTLSGQNAQEFSITSGGGVATILPGGTHNIVVGFEPITVGHKSATLGISSDDPNEDPFNVPLMGTGLDTNTQGLDSEFQIPQGFQLEQNYPNPFNPITYIRYHIPWKSNVKLTILNIQGQIVDTLVNRKQSAGSYQVQWDGNQFASGIYFYFIKTEYGNKFKKMVLIR